MLPTLKKSGEWRSPSLGDKLHFSYRDTVGFSYRLGFPTKLDFDFTSFSWSWSPLHAPMAGGGDGNLLVEIFKYLPGKWSFATASSFLDRLSFSLKESVALINLGSFIWSCSNFFCSSSYFNRVFNFFTSFFSFIIGSWSPLIIIIA